MIEDALRSRAWIVDSLGELIAAAPSMHQRPQREDVLRGIETAFRLAAMRKITIDRRSWTRQMGLASGTVLIDPLAIRHALEAVLATNELPAPSMRLVADLLGQAYASLHHYFPGLCRAIGSRHRNYQQAQRARARTRLREVCDAAIALTQHGLLRWCWTAERRSG